MTIPVLSVGIHETSYANGVVSPNPFPTPTALCPLAQGCRAAATLGNGIHKTSYANGVVSLNRGPITSEGHNPVGVGPRLFLLPG